MIPSHSVAQSVSGRQWHYRSNLGGSPPLKWAICTTFCWPIHPFITLSHCYPSAPALCTLNHQVANALQTNIHSAPGFLSNFSYYTELFILQSIHRYLPFWMMVNALNLSGTGSLAFFYYFVLVLFVCLFFNDCPVPVLSGTSGSLKHHMNASLLLNAPDRNN